MHTDDQKVVAPVGAYNTEEVVKRAERIDKARSAEREKKRAKTIFVTFHNNQHNFKLSKTAGAGIHGIS